jgi:hypothetical protein
VEKVNQSGGVNTQIIVAVYGTPQEFPSDCRQWMSGCEPQCLLHTVENCCVIECINNNTLDFVLFQQASSGKSLSSLDLYVERFGTQGFLHFSERPLGPKVVKALYISPVREVTINH